MNPSQSLKSQDEPCKPDCFSDNWQPPFPLPANTVVISLSECNNAQITVKFRQRRACNTWWDCYIENIEWLAPNDYEDCINSFGGLSNYVEAVTKLAFISLYPTSPQYVWRIMDGACWEADYEKKAIKPCNNINIVCCLQEYYVYYDGFQWKCQKTPSIFIEGECEQNQYNCIPVCGSIYGR